MDNSVLLIDNKCFGDSFLLTNVRPINYVDGKRVEQPVGYTYEVCVRTLRNDKLSVKIMGEQLMGAPSLVQDLYVTFAGLLVHPYVNRDGRIALTASATGIKAVPPKDPIDVTVTASANADKTGAGKQHH